MAVLTEPVKLFIVQALACYDTPSQVAAAVKEQFGVEITRMQASTYDLGKPTCRGLSKALQAVFKATREKFLDDVSSIPISQQAFRLRALQREFERAQSRGNSALAAQLLEQAAKECGGALTNRRELVGKDGGPIKTEAKFDVSSVSTAALAEIMAAKDASERS